MSWFLIALLNPIAHTLANYIDKFVLFRYVRTGSAWALALLSSLAAILIFPLLYAFNPNVVSGLSLGQAAFLMANGAFLTIAVAFYLKALHQHETSRVVALFQLAPVFGFMLGYLLLGETLNRNQLSAAILVIVGGLVVALNSDDGKKTFHWRLFAFMALSALFYSANAVGFKYIAVEVGFWGSVFWDMLGKFLFGLILLLGLSKVRKELWSMLYEGRRRLAILNFSAESLSLMGDVALMYALLYAPIAIVQSVSLLQPLFVIVLGAVIAKFLPSAGGELWKGRGMTQKMLGIIFMICGALILEFMPV